MSITPYNSKTSACASLIVELATHHEKILRLLSHSGGPLQGMTVPCLDACRNCYLTHPYTFLRPPCRRGGPWAPGASWTLCTLVAKELHLVSHPASFFELRCPFGLDPSMAIFWISFRSDIAEKFAEFVERPCGWGQSWPCRPCPWCGCRWL